MANEVVIRVRAEDQTGPPMQSALRNVQSFQTAAAGMGRTIAGFTAGQALLELPGLLSEASKAAQEDAASVAQLGQALKNAGLSQFNAELERTAEAAARFGVTDETARQSLSLLVAQTGSAEDAQRRFALAMDLSRGANIDLATASKLVGRITEENTNVLSRYGVTIRDGASETEALAAIQQKFGGQAEAFGESAAGSMARFTIAVDEAKESAGRLFGPLITMAAEAAAGTLEFVDMFTQGLGRMTGGARESFATMADAEAALSNAHGIERKALEEVIDKMREDQAEAEAAAAAVGEFGNSQADAATKTAVLNAMLEKQINNLGLTKMGFSESVPGIKAHMEAIEATTAAFEGLSQAQIDYLTGATAIAGTSIGGGVPAFPVASHAGGGFFATPHMAMVGDAPGGEWVLNRRQMESVVNNQQRSLVINGPVTVQSAGAQADDLSLLLRRI